MYVCAHGFICVWLCGEVNSVERKSGRDCSWVKLSLMVSSALKTYNHFSSVIHINACVLTLNVNMLHCRIMVYFLYAYYFPSLDYKAWFPFFWKNSRSGLYIWDPGNKFWQTELLYHFNLTTVFFKRITK